MAAFASGKAGEIRGLLDSEQVDLAGVSAAQATQLVADAFATPRTDLPSMIRVSLVVGAGKLARQKYPAELPRALVAALREAGYQEDSGAALLWECAGSFKHQHDTGKNLKIVHVYPLAEPPAADGEEDENGEEAWTPQQLLCICTMDKFEEVVRERTPTWKTRRQLQQELQEQAAGIAALEQKLMEGKALEAAEQRFYDAVGGDLMEAKAAYLQQSLRTMIEQGQITRRDKRAALEAATERLRDLQADEQPTAKVQKQIENVSQRIAHLESISPVEVPLQHEARIQEIWTKLGQLEPLEKKEASGHLSLNESKQLAERDELREELDRLLDASRAWFEGEEDFEDRKADLRNQWVQEQRRKREAARNKAKARKASGWAPTSSSRNATRAPQRTRKRPQGVKSKFAALGLSDSDDD